MSSVAPGTGGREAMIMSQRYPLYLDGVVAGSPAMRTGHSNLATRSVTVALNAIAPKDANGRPGAALSDGDEKAVIAKLLEVCDAAAVDNNPVARIGDSYNGVNLNSFSSHGGKLIFYHGLSDPWFSAKDTIDYYQRMTAANGGESKVKDWSRLFLSPGMGHCGGGSATLDTFDMRTASVTWVEKGQGSVEDAANLRVPAVDGGPRIRSVIGLA